MTVVGVTRDITERLRAEQFLAEQSKILESFFKHTQTCLVFLDKDFNFIRVNDAYTKAFRRDVSEFAGRNHFDLYPSDAKAEFERVVRTKERFEASARPFTFQDHHPVRLPVPRLVEGKPDTTSSRRLRGRGTADRDSRRGRRAGRASARSPLPG